MSTARKKSRGAPDVVLRVAVVNDYEIVVKGLVAMLEPFDERIVIVETEIGGVPSHPADIALFDTFAGHRTSLDRIDAMVEDHSTTKVVLYTWGAGGDLADGTHVRDVDAIISKSATGEELVTLLEQVHRGEKIAKDCTASAGHRRRLGVVDDRLGTLSSREQEVFAILAGGASNKQIADELFISAETVKSHVRSILGKLEAKNRTEAALIAHESGFGRRGAA